MTGIQEIVQLGGTVVVVFIFVYYLSKKDMVNQKTYEEFNHTITTHFGRSTEVIEKNNDAMLKVNVTLKELCIAIKNGNGKKKGVNI